MTHAVRNLWEKVVEFSYDQRAQGAFEYLLVLGGVSAVVVIAVATPVGSNLATTTVTAVCSKITGILPGAVCT
jgi:hypothetical protein